MIYIISDCLSPWHSYWIRIGQYLPYIEGEYEVSDDVNNIAKAKKGDIILVYRYNTMWDKFEQKIDIAKKNGVAIVTDIDDYVWEAPMGWDRARLCQYTRVVRKCDVITCSTESLRIQLKTMFKNTKIILLQNTEPKKKKIRIREDKKRIVVGWTGAPWTRKKDLECIRVLAKYIVNNNHRFRLLHIGHHDSKTSFAEVLGIPEICVEKKPLKGHQEYIDSIDFDIGLAPLTQNNFNYHKSGIKVIEYSHFGIPWIASKQNTYESLSAEWGIYGRLCTKEQEWIEHLEELCNYNLYNDESTMLQKICREKASFENGVKKWKTIFNILKIEFN